MKGHGCHPPLPCRFLLKAALTLQYPLGYGAVSYTHLDVYKRQDRIHVTYSGSDKVGEIFEKYGENIKTVVLADTVTEGMTDG